MSGKHNGARYSQNRTDTRIDTGMRVAGNISFTGVLRIQGDILGDVSCDQDSKGTLVVGQSGNVTGSIRAPHIVVNGRVSGPAHASESIEIQAGAYLVGDTCYKAIAVQAGGVVEGLLIPRVAMERGEIDQQPAIRVSSSPEVRPDDMPIVATVPAGSRHSDRSRNARMLGWSAILLIAVVTAWWVNRDPVPMTSSGADVALKASSSMSKSPAELFAPAGSGELQRSPRGVAADQVAAVPSSDALSQSIVQATSPAFPENEPAEAVMVQGVNPRKPANVLSITSEAPAILFKKQRQDTSSGTRIDISRGEKITLAIAKNEIVRVADGRDIMIFYQGRKVSPKMIASGAWISFLPLPAAGAGDRE